MRMFQPVDVLVVVPADSSTPSDPDSSGSSDDVWIRVALLDRGVAPDDPSVLPQVGEANISALYFVGVPFSDVFFCRTACELSRPPCIRPSFCLPGVRATI